MSSTIFASILALVAAEVCELGQLGELEALEPSCLLQTPWPPASLLTESGEASDPMVLCFNCWCDDTDEAAPIESGTEGFFNRCNDYCATFSRPLFETYQDDFFNPDNPTIECRCCRSNEREDTSFPGHQVWQVVPPTTTTGANAAGAYGDPHIKTLDGKRYILLSQGTFSLWRYSGEAELIRKKVPVDWEVYTHYSGHQSFTKGLLLLDRSAGSPRQLLEITADDCQWRARKGAASSWTAVQDEETVALRDGNDYISGFVVDKKNGPNGHNHVRLNMQTKDGKADIAVLSLSCRPKHHLNVQMIMKRASDLQFVNGQLKPARKVSFSSQQVSTDSEFVLNSTWQDMGGSAQAAAYLQSVDEMQEPNPSLLSTCSSADEDQARQTCFKHLGHVDQGNADEAAFLNDCIFDVCHGAGETAAELAAELRASTQAI